MTFRIPAARTLQWALPITCGFVTLFALTPGCGGSGGSGDAKTISASEVEQVIGPFVTRAVGTTQAPVVQRGDSSVITGIAGATFNSIVERAAAVFPLPTPTPFGGTSAWWGTRYIMSTTQFGKEAIFASQPIESNSTVPDFVRLTDNNANNSLPAWSPDVKQIAFVSDRDGNQEIYVMGVDGTNQRRLTNDSSIDSEPVWSPDGKKIAFISRRTGNSEIFVMNADGTDPVNITNDPGEDRSPSWSSDGTTLAFSSNRAGQYDIWRMFSDGSQIKNLTNSPDANEFEPSIRNGGNVFNGFTILFIRQGNDPSATRQLWRMDADGPQQYNVNPNSSLSTFNYYRPRWLPFMDIYYSGDYTFLSDADGRQYGAYNSNRGRIVADGVKSFSASPYYKIYPTPTPTPSSTPSVRNLVGSGGLVASACGGFLYGLRRSVYYDYSPGPDLVLTSFVTVDTVPTGRNDLRIVAVPDNANTANYNNGIILFSVTAGDNKITSLRYLNATEKKVTYAIGGTGNAPAGGALIYINPSNSEVDTVLPYDATKSVDSKPKLTREGDMLVLRGNFTGAYDATGKNRAPHGLRELRINSKTGKVIE